MKEEKKEKKKERVKEKKKPIAAVGDVHFREGLSDLIRGPTSLSAPIG